MWTALLQPDVVIFSAAISAYELGSQWQQALSLLDAMVLQRVTVDLVCFRAAVLALADGRHCGMEALELMKGLGPAGLQASVPWRWWIHLHALFRGGWEFPAMFDAMMCDKFILVQLFLS